MFYSVNPPRLPLPTYMLSAMVEVEENPNIVVAEEESIKKKRKRKRDKRNKMVVEKETKKEKENEDEEDERQEDDEEQKKLDDELKAEIKKEMKSGLGIMSAELFSSVEISEPTMKAIKDMGFEYMTQVNYTLFYLYLPCLYLKR